MHLVFILDTFNVLDIKCLDNLNVSSIKMAFALLHCKKLGSGHDAKSFATGAFLERIVVKRANLNDDLC